MSSFIKISAFSFTSSRLWLQSFICLRGAALTALKFLDRGVLSLFFTVYNPQTSLCSFLWNLGTQDDTQNTLAAETLVVFQSCERHTLFLSPKQNWLNATTGSEDCFEFEKISTTESRNVTQ